MIRGVGLDLCEIERMEKLRMMTRFMERYFTGEEQEYIRSKGRNAAQTMAGIFAAKEALAKALGSGLDFDLREAEVAHDEVGRPFYRFSGKLPERARGTFHLSISHDAGVAGAVCVWEADAG